LSVHHFVFILLPFCSPANVLHRHTQ
jgi:hypothetical protein